MQVPIDFYVALLDSGSIIIIILLCSLLIFAYRIREIYADIGIGTRRALIAYAMAGIAMALATIVGLMPEMRFLITGTGAFFLAAIVTAELWILYSEKRAIQGTILSAVLVIGTITNNFLGLPQFGGYPQYFMMIALSILLIASVSFAIMLIRENPSTFTASLFIVLLLYMATWVIGATYWTFNHPEFYVLQVIPLIVAAAIYSSVRKPWRTTLAVFIMYFSLTIGIPILSGSYNVGSWTIFTFVGIELVTALCLISPLNYFLDQHAETGAKAPLYLGGVVASIALLVSTHSLSWAVFISNELVWNDYIVWVDVLIGCTAIVAFMLAAVTSLFGEWVHTITREGMIVFSTAAAFLTFPLTQPEGITNNDVWLVLGMVIILGVLLFVVLSYRIAKAGGRRAAANLMMFVLSAVMIAIVSMYSDNIPPLPPDVPMVVIALLIFANIMSVFSNPNFVTEAKRRFRRDQATT
jgi:hypothetical protein